MRHTGHTPGGGGRRTLAPQSGAAARSPAPRGGLRATPPSMPAPPHLVPHTTIRPGISCPSHPAVAHVSKSSPIFSICPFFYVHLPFADWRNGSDGVAIRPAAHMLVRGEVGAALPLPTDLICPASNRSCLVAPPSLPSSVATITITRIKKPSSSRSALVSSRCVSNAPGNTRAFAQTLSEVCLQICVDGVCVFIYCR